jgi:murein DD-endopeptidase MepM/ murein hydrolase activator NlpD
VLQRAAAIPTESPIFTLDEPPSPRGRKALNVSRRIRVIYNSTPLRLKLAASVGLVLMCLVSGTAYAKLHAQPTQSTADSERVAFTLSSYLQPDTLAPAATSTDFSTVAFAGENVGGLPSNEAALRQYVVQNGDTLSTIASKYDLHSGSIILANKDIIDDTELIHPGQVLFIPDSDASAQDLSNEYTQRQQKITAKTAATKKVATTSTSTTKKSTNASAKSNSDSSGLHLMQPMPYYTYISQPFNAVTHTGIDFATDPGTPVRAVADGCIVLAATGYNGGYGTTIIMDIGNGYTVRDAHLSAIAKGVSSGACFDAGDIIGYSGNTGRSTGPHLHFEVRLNGIPKNPAIYL